MENTARDGLASSADPAGLTAQNVNDASGVEIGAARGVEIDAAHAHAASSSAARRNATRCATNTIAAQSAAATPVNAAAQNNSTRIKSPTTRKQKHRRQHNTVAPAVSGEVADEFQHVQCLVDQLPEDLTVEQRAAAEDFIKKRSHVFSKSEFDIGRTDVIKHQIDTGHNAPHFEQLRRHPTTQLPVIDRHVDEMLQHDVIEPAASPWCSNVVMVKKRDGTMRFCVDYRKVNQLIKKDKFPLPKIDTCLDMLNGCCFYSSCDLRQGYWQTMLQEEDRDKTAFVTRKGQWKFKVLSFGLCNAPSKFTRTMELIMSGLTYDICLIYLDDILIFSKTFEEHCDRLARVFDRLCRRSRPRASQGDLQQYHIRLQQF